MYQRLAASPVGAAVAGSPIGHAAQVVAGSPVGTMVREKADQLQQLLAEKQAEIDELRREKLALMNDLKQKAESKITNVVLERVDKLFSAGMQKVLVHAKKAAVDPYMPSFVKRLIEEALEAIWPDVEIEIREKVFAKLRTRAPIAHGAKPCCFNPRAFIKYTINPYDRTIWRQIRDPVWWFFTLTAAIPRFGIPIICFGILLLVIDKRDEYQLLTYVTQFKGMQFISLGVISAVIGAAQYYFCATATSGETQVTIRNATSTFSIVGNATAESTAGNTCDRFSPQEELFTVFLFIIEALLVYVAFFLSTCSVKKGGQLHQFSAVQRERMEKIAAEDAADPAAGGGRIAAILSGENVGALIGGASGEEAQSKSHRRLAYFLVWDLFTFIISGGLIAWTLLMNVKITSANDLIDNPDWRLLAALYAAKTLYGLLSFPFLVFAIPGLSALVAHARPTGYNPYGHTVPMIGSEEEGPVPWDPNRGTKGGGHPKIAAEMAPRQQDDPKQHNDARQRLLDDIL